MGKAVLDLQNKLPRARVVYASATGRQADTHKNIYVMQYYQGFLKYNFSVIFAPGASEPKNMIYMSRLGIWGEGTPFRTFDDFLHAIEKRFVEFHSVSLCFGRVSQSCVYISSNGCAYWKMHHNQFVVMSGLHLIALCGMIYTLFVYRGVGAMEIVAMDMKVSGMYIARQLSFSGVSFRIEEIGLDSDFKLVYNKAAKLVSIKSLLDED